MSTSGLYDVTFQNTKNFSYHRPENLENYNVNAWCSYFMVGDQVSHLYKVRKVKQCLCRPEQSLRALGGRGCRIF